MWRSAELHATVPVSDVASEVVWSLTAALGVFDHGGRLSYSNPAFQELGRQVELVDARGYLTSAPIEDARRRTLQRRGSGRGRSLAVGVSSQYLDVDVLPLEAAPEWTAIVFYKRAPADQVSPDTLTLPVLVHELKAPLLLAQESLEALTQVAADSPADLRGAVARQARALTRLTGVVQGLSDLSRARGLERSRPSWTNVNLAEQVQEIALVYTDLAQSRGFELVVDVEPDVPAIQGNGELLARAISNLVDNALKYATPTGPVRLALGRHGALAVVEVADSGPGIAPEDQAAVFREFFRLAADRATNAPGTGLGLAVAKRVAEAHGGRLSLESWPGIGSTFRLSFLLAARD